MDYVLIQTKPKLSPPSSGSSTDPYAGVDGSPNAAIGSAQWPNERANYAHPPAWKVSGWDYPVGINANLTMTNSGSTILFTYNPPPSLVAAVPSATAHGLVAGQIVTFYAQQDNISGTSGLPLTSTNVLPSALIAGTPYYVISTGLTTTQFEVSTTSGGSAISASISGMTGSNFFFLRDPFSSYTSNTAATLVPALTAIGGVYGAYVGNGQGIGFSGSAANNATLWGYDFSLHTGIAVAIANCSGFIVRDCLIVEGGGGTSYGGTCIGIPGVASGLTTAQVATNVTIEYNIIDGGALQGYNNNNSAGIESNALGTHLVQYNWIKNFWNEGSVFGQASTTGTQNITFQFNLTECCGVGFPIDQSHGDWLQAFNQSGCNTANWGCNYNLWRQPNLTGTYAGTSCQGPNLLTAAGNSGTATSGAMNNNTCVCLGSAITGTINKALMVQAPAFTNPVPQENNYIDPTGTWTQASVIFYGNLSGGGSYSSPSTGNIDMTNGNTIVQNATMGGEPPGIG